MVTVTIEVERQGHFDFRITESDMVMRPEQVASLLGEVTGRALSRAIAAATAHGQPE